MKTKILATFWLTLMLLSFLMTSVYAAEYGFSDNFNDNSLDTTKWTITKYGTTTVSEKNQRLEVKVSPSTTENWGGGLVTKDYYTLTRSFGCEFFFQPLPTPQYTRNFHMILSPEKRTDICHPFPKLSTYVDFVYERKPTATLLIKRKAPDTKEYILYENPSVGVLKGLRIEGISIGDLILSCMKNGQTTWTYLTTLYAPIDLMQSYIYMTYEQFEKTATVTTWFDDFSLSTNMVELVRDSGFNTALCGGNWEKCLPSWNSKDESGTDCDVSISGSIIYMWTDDTANSEYSDASAFQGKKPHATGYFCSGSSKLRNEIILNEGNNWGQNNLWVKMYIKVPYEPIKREGTIDYSIAWTNCAGLLVMVYLDLYVYNPSTNQYYWLNFDDPDVWGSKNMAVLEMFNRWAYDLGTWVQVDSSDVRYNFCTTATTHDSDWHNICAGWIVVVGQWQWVEKDVGIMVKQMRDYILYAYTNGWVDYYLIDAKVRTVAVSVETYLAKFEGQIDECTLMWTG